MGLATSQNIVDASKIRRQRSLLTDSAIAEHSSSISNIRVIGFDGKIDKTLSDGRMQAEEHYVVLSFPGTNYVDHVSPQSGSANHVAAELITVCNDTGSVTSLEGVICDGAVVNTGKHNGIIRKLELELRRPLQWIICLLHLNELPLRAFFKAVDGFETGN